MAGHIASPLSVEWCTPDEINAANEEVFGGKPDLDPADNEHSRVGAKTSYRLPTNDGLLDSWDFETIFNNPPFGNAWWRLQSQHSPSCSGEFYELGRLTPTCLCNIGRREYIYSLEGLSAKERRGWNHVSIADWVERAARAYTEHGSTVIQLLPSAVATVHFQDIIFKTATAVCFPRGRLHYRLVETVPDHAADCPGELWLAQLKRSKVKKKDLPSHEELLRTLCKCQAREGSTKLIETNGPAPMDSAVIYWGGNPTKAFHQAYGKIGKVIYP